MVFPKLSYILGIRNIWLGSKTTEMNFSLIHIPHYDSENKTHSLVMNKIIESKHFILQMEVEINSKHIRKQRRSKKKHTKKYLKIKRDI